MDHNNVNDVAAPNIAMICDNCHERPGEISHFLYCGTKPPGGLAFLSGGFTFYETISIKLCKDCIVKDDLSSSKSLAIFSAIVIVVSVILLILPINVSPIICSIPIIFFGIMLSYSLLQYQKARRGVLDENSGLNLAKTLAKASPSISYAKASQPISEKDEWDSRFVILNAEELAKMKLNVRTTHTKPQLPEKCINCAAPTQYKQRPFTIVFKDKVAVDTAKYESSKKDIFGDVTSIAYQVPYRDSEFEVNFGLCGECINRDTKTLDVSFYVKTFTQNVSIRYGTERRTLSYEIQEDNIDWAFKSHEYAKEFEALNTRILLSRQMPQKASQDISEGKLIA